MESLPASPNRVHGRAPEQLAHESPVQQYGHNFLDTILKKATTSLSPEQSNREWTAAALFPIINLFTQFVTFRTASVEPEDQIEILNLDMLSVPPQAPRPLEGPPESLLSASTGGLGQVEDEDEPALAEMKFHVPSQARPRVAVSSQPARPAPLAQRVTTLNIPLEKLKSLVVGNIAALIISLGVAYFAGFGLTLIHGLAHLAILCSAVNLADIARVAQSRGQLSDLTENLLGEAIKGSGHRRAHAGQGGAPSSVEMHEVERDQPAFYEPHESAFLRERPARRLRHSQQEEKFDPRLRRGPLLHSDPYSSVHGRPPQSPPPHSHARRGGRHRGSSSLHARPDQTQRSLAHPSGGFWRGRSSDSDE